MTVRMAALSLIAGALLPLIGEAQPSGQIDLEQRFRRVDDGGVTGKKDYRYEPETSSGPGEVFVYYTVDKVVAGRPVVHGLRRRRTGIMNGGH